MRYPSTRDRPTPLTGDECTTVLVVVAAVAVAAVAVAAAVVAVVVVVVPHCCYCAFGVVFAFVLQQQQQQQQQRAIGFYGWSVHVIKKAARRRMEPTRRNKTKRKRQLVKDGIDETELTPVTSITESTTFAWIRKYEPAPFVTCFGEK